MVSLPTKCLMDFCNALSEDCSLLPEIDIKTNAVIKKVIALYFIENSFRDNCFCNFFTKKKKIFTESVQAALIVKLK